MRCEADSLSHFAYINFGNCYRTRECLLFKRQWTVGGLHGDGQFANGKSAGNRIYLYGRTMNWKVKGYFCPTDTMFGHWTSILRRTESVYDWNCISDWIFIDSGYDDCGVSLALSLLSSVADIFCNCVVYEDFLSGCAVRYKLRRIRERVLFSAIPMYFKWHYCTAPKRRLLLWRI